MDAPENYRLIIDCLLNLPLLYWASDETGDPKYRDIAEKHIHTAVANVIREDYSTWHTFFFDMKTGAPDHGATCQGYRDGSAWARGQAWGVYGMALAYRYTGRKEYIDLFRHVTEYFLEHLPRIWYRTGIWNSPTGMTSREIPPLHPLQPAVCWRWRNTWSRKKQSITLHWQNRSCGLSMWLCRKGSEGIQRTGAAQHLLKSFSLQYL